MVPRSRVWTSRARPQSFPPVATSAEFSHRTGSSSVTLVRMPAFAQSLPAVIETALAAVLTALGGLGGGALAQRVTALLQPAALDDPGDPIRA
jgi:hypothetical protein